MASSLIDTTLRVAQRELHRAHELTLPGYGVLRVAVDDVLTLVGAAVVAVLLLRTLACFARGLVSRFTARSPRSYGEWAVVTGATDGIGKAFAKRLAKRGLNVVLISRTQANLDKAVEDIKAAVGDKVQLRTIVADFSADFGDAAYDHISNALKELDVGILVNNVGVSYPSALYFHELEKYEPGLTKKMINMNVVAVTRMTSIVLPGMLQRRRGAIVNISSAAGRIPVGNPLYAEYSGSKAYVDYFSRSLHYEYAPQGISVQCFSPYFVTTKLSKLRHATLTTPTPDAYAAAAVASIGRGGPSVVPFWAHGLQDWVLQRLPASLLAPALVNMHKGLRARYLKKVQAGEGSAQPAAEGPSSSRKKTR